MAKVECKVEDCKFVEDQTCQCTQLVINHKQGCACYEHDVSKSRKCGSCRFNLLEDDPGDERRVLSKCTRHGTYLDNYEEQRRHIICWAPRKKEEEDGSK